MRIEQHEIMERLARLRQQGHDYTLKVSIEATGNPADDIEAARRHHKMHGDMDGNTCLLNKCALHYPNE